MESPNDKMDEILNCAQRCLYFNEILIEQCNSWLSAEEGNKNMEARIIKERKRDNKTYKTKF